MSIRLFYLILLTLSFFSCKSKDPELLFTDSTATYKVENKGLEENGLYIFHDIDNPESVKAVGALVNGFRDGVWNYYQKSKNHLVRWALYKDKELGYSTNLLAEADSTIHGDFFTRFLFSTEHDKILVGVIINGPIKDSLPEKNYRRISENYYRNARAKLISYNTTTLSDSSNRIYINDVVLDDSLGKRRFLKSAFAFVGKQKNFIEFSVTSSEATKQVGYILFDGILSAFFINGERLYNPFYIKPEG